MIWGKACTPRRRKLGLARPVDKNWGLVPPSTKIGPCCLRNQILVTPPGCSEVGAGVGYAVDVGAKYSDAVGGVLGLGVDGGAGGAGGAGGGLHNARHERHVLPLGAAPRAQSPPRRRLLRWVFLAQVYKSDQWRRAGVVVRASAFSGASSCVTPFSVLSGCVVLYNPIMRSHQKRWIGVVVRALDWNIALPLVETHLGST